MFLRFHFKQGASYLLSKFRLATLHARGEGWTAKLNGHAGFYHTG
jgi:hypothetical protein